MAKLGYTWYPKDWKMNEKVFDMRLELRGFYREMIDFGYENDNFFELSEKYWSRLLGVKVVKFRTLLGELLALKVIEKDGNKYSIPSIEPRIQLIRSGRKGGKTSKPTPKQKQKPLEKPEPKQNSNQIEIETEKERESKELGFDNFWNKYHYITKKPKYNESRSFLIWAELTNKEREAAIRNIKNYYDNIDDRKFVKKASRYLEEKVFLDKPSSKINVNSNGVPKIPTSLI